MLFIHGLFATPSSVQQIGAPGGLTQQAWNFVDEFEYKNVVFQFQAFQSIPFSFLLIGTISQGMLKVIEIS